MFDAALKNVKSTCAGVGATFTAVALAFEILTVTQAVVIGLCIVAAGLILAGDGDKVADLFAFLQSKTGYPPVAKPLPPPPEPPQTGSQYPPAPKSAPPPPAMK